MEYESLAGVGRVNLLDVAGSALLSALGLAHVLFAERIAKWPYVRPIGLNSGDRARDFRRIGWVFAVAGFINIVLGCVSSCRSSG